MKGDQGKGPGDRHGAGGRFRARDQADDVGREDEEEQRREEGDVLLVAFADNVAAPRFRQ
jgi:hypothetical protein